MESVDGRFDYLLPAVQEELLRQNVPLPRGEHDPTFSAFRSRIAAQIASLLSRQEREQVGIMPIAQRFARMLVGIGLIEPLLEDEEVEEIIVRRGRVFVDRGGQIDDLGELAPDEHFYRVAAYVADTRAGRGLSPQYPVVLVDLPGGERFTAMVPPLSPEGTIINVRRWRVKRHSLDDLMQMDTFPGPRGRTLATTLVAIVRHLAASILISGAFSTGKTTLLNALLAHVREGVQVAVAESFRELDVRHPATARVVVPAFVREGEDRITLAQAVNSLLTRARPDLIVMGEITSHDEAREFLRAANLGVRAMGTIHGNSAYGALVRLADLAVREGSPLSSVRSQVAEAVDLVIHMQREGKWRYVSEVVWVKGVNERGDFELEPVYRYGQGHRAMLYSYLSALRG